MVTRLNESINLPVEIQISFEDCHDTEVFYDDQNHHVTICHEWLDEMQHLVSRRNNDKSLIRESVEILVQIFAPMMPHLAEECWQVLGHGDLLAESAWPHADPALLASETATIAIQVNGKRRDEIVLPLASSAEEIEAAVLRMDNVRRAVGDKTVRRVVVVPGRIANIVTD